MGYDTSTIGKSSATNTANSWQNFLGNGLTTGKFGSTNDPTTGAPSNTPAFINPSSNGALGFSDFANTTNKNNGYDATGKYVGSPNPSGGLGIPPNNPSQGPSTTSSIGDYINGLLSGGLTQQTYNNPNNPRPTGYTPNTIDTSANSNAAMGTANTLANSQGVSPTAQYHSVTDPGNSSTFSNSQNGQLSLAQVLAQYAGNISSNPTGGNATPGQSNASTNFSSNGLLGDRSNVVNALTAENNKTLSQALSANNARFTANGGMAFGTPAAYSNASLENQNAVDFTNALAGQDLAYRNQDLNAFSAQNTAALGNAANNNSLYATLMNALSNSRNTSANLLGTASNTLGNVSGAENTSRGLGITASNDNATNAVATDKINADSLLGFFQQNSNNLTNAGNLQLGAGNLVNNTGQNNNNNLFNSAGIASQNYRDQGTLDQNYNSTFQNSLGNLMNQLFSSYNNSTNQGLPKADTSVTPNFGTNALQSLGGIFSGIGSIAKATG